MDYVYMLIYGSDWDETEILLSMEDAINASIKHPKNRVEIFRKNDNNTGYSPTYSYYRNGELIRGALG